MSNLQGEERKMPSKANENSKWKQANCLKRGKNAGDQDVFGFSFASDWLREWREFFFLPIKERSEAKKKSNPRFSFDTHLKIVLL